MNSQPQPQTYWIRNSGGHLYKMPSRWFCCLLKCNDDWTTALQTSRHSKKTSSLIIRERKKDKFFETIILTAILLCWETEGLRVRCFHLLFHFHYVCDLRVYRVGHATCHTLMGPKRTHRRMSPEKGMMREFPAYSEICKKLDLISFTSRKLKKQFVLPVKPSSNFLFLQNIACNLFRLVFFNNLTSNWRIFSTYLIQW